MRRAMMSIQGPVAWEIEHKRSFSLSVSQLAWERWLVWGSSAQALVAHSVTCFPSKMSFGNQCEYLEYRPMRFQPRYFQCMWFGTHLFIFWGYFSTLWNSSDSITFHRVLVELKRFPLSTDLDIVGPACLTTVWAAKVCKWFLGPLRP